MAEYTPPCARRKCGQPSNATLCKGLANTFIEAGATSVFEATPCPIEAINVLLAAEGEEANNLRHKLGIVGVIGTETGLEL